MNNAIYKTEFWSSTLEKRELLIAIDDTIEDGRIFTKNKTEKLAIWFLFDSPKNWKHFFVYVFVPVKSNKKDIIKMNCDTFEEYMKMLEEEEEEYND